MSARADRRRHLLMLLLAGGLVVLLCALAALQYRWLGQISVAERERMQRTLRAGADRFAEDFDAELGRVYFGLQTDAELWRRRDGEEFALRFDRWRATAAHAGLVREVFVMERGREGRATLARFDPAARAFLPAEWPAEFARLRARLEGAEALPDPEGTLRVVAALPNVEPDIPAVVIPVVSSEQGRSIVGRGGDEERMLLTNYSPVSAYVVAALDADVVRRELLAGLAGRYFAAGGETDYRVAVVSRGDSARALYQSDPGASVDVMSAPDARADIFHVRPEGMEQLLSPETPLELRKVMRTQGGRTPGGAGGEEGTAGGGAKKVTLLKHATRESTTQIMQTPGRGGAGWELLVAHRAGSLDAAVAGARRRNLLLGSAVLTLLAASAALIVVSALRAQRLARRQVEFVAGVSHELRTPLAVICSAGENLADGVIKDTAQVRRYGELIRSEGRRLTEMVEQALEFAGARSGRGSLKLASVSVAEVVGAALASCRGTDDGGRVTFETDMPAELPPVLADADALRRSLQNIVGNAMKYGGEGGWIGVRARAVSGPRGDAEVRIEVEDRGAGIAPSDLPHIFEPFYRGREAVAAQIHGSGLGLSLTRGIVEAHGGRISVESTPGRGSVFTLHLRATNPEVCCGADDAGGGLAAL